MAGTVQFGRKSVDDAVSELQEIVNKVKAASGSASARKTAATHDWLGKDVPADLVIPGDSGPDFETWADVAFWIDDVVSWAEQMCDEGVTEILRGQAKQATETDALRALYDEKKAVLTAMLTMCTAVNIDVSDVSIPSLRGSSSGGSGRPSKSRFLTFGRTVSGTEKPMSDGQQKFSSVGWYHGAAMTGITAGPDSTNNGKGVTSHALSRFLKSQGHDNPEMTPWEITVDGVVYWARAIPTDSPADSETPADSTDGNSGD